MLAVNRDESQITAVSSSRPALRKQVNYKQNDRDQQNHVNQQTDYVEKNERAQPQKKEEACEDEKRVTHTPILACLTPAIR
ncbi:MAG TPA: hypothetical protein VMB47_01380 [Candidatus Aquilonibacter sp.]|nr:hypothetical protein [Candidatus Aquilonibacter sp.]